MNENASQTYRRRSSSILKQPKSPRQALHHLDNEAGKAHQEGKSCNTERHLSRRVSFADTCQVQEFCKENSNSENPSPSPDLRNVPEYLESKAVSSVSRDVLESLLPAHHSLLTGQILYLPFPVTDSTNESKASLVLSNESSTGIQETRKRIPLSVLNPVELEREACERNDVHFCEEALLDSTFITSPILETNDPNEYKPGVNHHEFGELNQTVYGSESNNDMEMTDVENFSLGTHSNAPSSLQAQSKTFYCDGQSGEMEFTKVSNFTICVANESLHFDMDFKNLSADSDQVFFSNEKCNAKSPTLNKAVNISTDNGVVDMELTEIDISTNIVHNDIDPKMPSAFMPLDDKSTDQTMDSLNAQQSVVPTHLECILERPETKEQLIIPLGQFVQSQQNGGEEMEFTNVEDSKIIVSQNDLLKDDVLPTALIEIDKKQIKSIPNVFLAPNPINLPYTLNVSSNILSPVPKDNLSRAFEDLNDSGNFMNISSPAGPLPVCSTARAESNPSRFSISKMNISAENIKNNEFELYNDSRNSRKCPDKLVMDSSHHQSHFKDNIQTEIVKLPATSVDMELTECGTEDTMSRVNADHFRNLSTVVFDGTSADMQLTNCATTSSGWLKTARPSEGCKSLKSLGKPLSTNSLLGILASENSDVSTSVPLPPCANEFNELRNSSADQRGANANTGIESPNVFLCNESTMDIAYSSSISGSDMQKDANESRDNQILKKADKLGNPLLACYLETEENIEPSANRQDKKDDNELLPPKNKYESLNLTPTVEATQHKRISPQQADKDEVPCKKVVKETLRSNSCSTPHSSSFQMPNLPRPTFINSILSSTKRNPVQYGFSRPWKLNCNKNKSAGTHLHLATAAVEVCGNETETASLTVSDEKSGGTEAKVSVGKCVDNETSCGDIVNISYPSLMDECSLNSNLEESVRNPAEEFLCQSKESDIPVVIPEEELCRSYKSNASVSDMSIVEKSQIMTNETTAVLHDGSIEIVRGMQHTIVDELPNKTRCQEENSVNANRWNFRNLATTRGRPLAMKNVVEQQGSQAFKSRLNLLIEESQQIPQNASTLMELQKQGECECVGVDIRAETTIVGSNLQLNAVDKQKENTIPVHRITATKLVANGNQEPGKLVEIHARIDTLLNKVSGKTAVDAEKFVKINSQAVGSACYSGQTINAEEDLPVQLDKAKKLLDSKWDVAIHEDCSSECYELAKKGKEKSKSVATLKEGVEVLKVKVEANLGNDDEAWKALTCKLKPVEPIVKKINNVSMPISEYKIKVWTSECIHLSFWQNCLHLKFDLGDMISNETVEFGFDEEKLEIREVLAVRQWTLNIDNFEPIRKWAHQTMWRAFEKENIVFRCKTTLNLQQILPTLCMYSSDSRMLFLDASRASFMHSFDIHENTMTVEFGNYKALMGFKLAFTVEPGTYPNRRLPAKLEVLIGDVSEEEVFSVLRSVQPGHSYLYNMVKAVDNWLISKPCKE